MARALDSEYIGKIFNYLTVISRAESDKHGNSRWNCLCKCGETKIVLGYALNQRTTSSCGCFHKEWLIERSTKHNLRFHPLYSIWCAMKTRCTNKNAIQSKNYAGKGVVICKEWINDFKSFYDWAIANGWAEGLQIDKDIKGNGLLYSPDTCCFVTSKENCNNKTNNNIISYGGTNYTLSSLAEKFGMTYHTLFRRIKAGWELEAALKKPIGKSRFKIPEIRYAFGFIG